MLRARRDGEEGEGGEESEKTFHRYEGTTILSQIILKSESRWMGVDILPGVTSPWEAALRLAHLPGLIFLDSALTGPEAVSVIAAEPEEKIEGETEGDWERLREAIRARAGTPGFAAGYVEYEGRFHFDLYGKALIYRHGEGRWTDSGGLRDRMARRW